MSHELYRVTADHRDCGQDVEIDGWDEALATAWRELVNRPEAERWLDAYLASCGNEGLTVTFGDTTRIVGRHGYGNFNVSYPASLLLTTEDKARAVRTAILVVLDRHVHRSNLDVPLLSSVVTEA